MNELLGVVVWSSNVEPYVCSERGWIGSGAAVWYGIEIVEDYL